LLIVRTLALLPRWIASWAIVISHSVASRTFLIRSRSRADSGPHLVGQVLLSSLPPAVAAGAAEGSVPVRLVAGGAS
jgi:hypothetical protein